MKVSHASLMSCLVGKTLSILTFIEKSKEGNHKTKGRILSFIITFPNRNRFQKYFGLVIEDSTEDTKLSRETRADDVTR